MTANLIARAQKIRLIAFDVDGVMTDGTLFLADDGQEYKGFNSLDGHGLKMLKNSGVELAIITGRSSRVVEHRARNLGIEIVHQGAHDKLVVYEALCRELKIDCEATAYMAGDAARRPGHHRACRARTGEGAQPLHDDARSRTRRRTRSLRIPDAGARHAGRGAGPLSEMTGLSHLARPGTA